MRTERGGAGRTPVADAIAALSVAACLAVYLWWFLPLAPGFGPMYGPDYGLHFPNLLAGYFHVLANGPLSVPWFNPGECAGVPFLADLNVGFYSLPQALSMVVDPASAVRVTFVVFALTGAAGFHLLLRSRFGASPWAAATGAVLFLFNGFYLARMEVGHLTFHPFMLAPWIAWAALLPASAGARWTARRGVLAVGLVGAIFAYQFQAGMQHIIIPVVLAAVVIVLVDGHRRGHAWQPWVILGLGAVLALGLSAQRLAAAVAFLTEFPRTLYPLPGLASLTEVLTIAGLSLFWHPPTDLAVSELQNSRWGLMWHEWAYGVGPAALVLLVAGAAVVLVRLATGRSRWRPLGGPALTAAIVAVLAIPIALNLYTPGWNAVLKGLPVLGESVTLFRWFVLYIPLIAFGAALAVDRLAPARPWAGGLFVVVAVATLGWNARQPDRAPLKYDGAPIERAWHAAASGVPPITELKAEMNTAAVTSFADRNNAMVEGASEIECYQPIFGYQLEDLPLGDLHVGPIVAPAGAGTLNFRNPACYLFPRQNGCAANGQFRSDQRAALLRFAAYRSFPFARPPLQVVAGWANLATLAATLLAGIVALLWRPRRRPDRDDLAA